MLEKQLENDIVMKFLSYFNFKENIDEIVTLMIIKGRYSLTENMLKSYDVKFNSIFVKVALEYDSLSIVFLIRKLYPNNFSMHEREYLSSLMLSMERSNSSWLAKFFLLKTIINQINYIKAEQIWLFIHKIIQRDAPETNPLYYAPNVLLFSWNLIELWKIIYSKFKFLGAYTDKIIEIITKLAANYIENIDDEFELRALVFEKDYENRDSLELLSTYNIVEIMNNKNMEKIAMELWTSQYDVKGNLMTTSSAYQIVMDDSFNQPKDILYNYIFFNWKYRTFENFEHHLYQFEVWK